MAIPEFFSAFISFIFWTTITLIFATGLLFVLTMFVLAIMYGILKVCKRGVRW